MFEGSYGLQCHQVPRSQVTHYLVSYPNTFHFRFQMLSKHLHPSDRIQENLVWEQKNSGRHSSGFVTSWGSTDKKT